MPPTPLPAAAAVGSAPAPARKIFNCIVDDTALVAGVKRSTRNGIRQWVKNGQIRLFVPLHALEELSRQKGAKNRHADDVRETLQWLDEATSKHPDVVTLQGADETYERWAEVERFAVPRTMFSEQDYEPEHDEEADELAEVTASKLRLSAQNLDASLSSAASDLSRSMSPSSSRSVRSSASPVSPPTSPSKAAISPMQNLSNLVGVSSRPQSSSDSVPQPLQPLFNYILWRVHQEMDPVAALESFIFLCNDPRKVNFAKGFDIKVKRLEQLREAVGREDRDHKNRQNLLIRETQNLAPKTGELAHDQSQDEEVVFKPAVPRAPAAMLQKHSNLIDPNTFGRGPQPKASVPIKDLPNGAPKSPRAAHAAPQRGSPRGVHALPFAPRANMRGGPRGNFRGSVRGRGNFGSTHTSTFVTENVTPDGQIDPDSFSRPDPRSSIGGSRGGRKLWVPT
ncbi:uncharacterized protein RCC_02848 [Ramularia collo-cygni]|uniref:Uncharacterized protein n=1 Tax=Ramularia collo-cygni TaxID=112498 RepID=A0A2D3V0G6_9PEZI|nr:uncharacterized protein RCC_02848 [Ramularia collo-cygni]CZT17016.1 uncharacterized protein RCC_02848 [Ramularia collo-cygni]